MRLRRDGKGAGKGKGAAGKTGNIVQNVVNLITDAPTPIPTLAGTQPPADWSSQNFSPAPAPEQEPQAEPPKMPVNQAPVNQAPANQGPATQLPLTQAPAAQLPVTQMPQQQGSDPSFTQNTVSDPTNIAQSQTPHMALDANQMPAGTSLAPTSNETSPSTFPNMTKIQSENNGTTTTSGSSHSTPNPVIITSVAVSLCIIVAIIVGLYYRYNKRRQTAQTFYFESLNRTEKKTSIVSEPAMNSPEVLVNISHDEKFSTLYEPSLVEYFGTEGHKNETTELDPDLLYRIRGAIGVTDTGRHSDYKKNSILNVRTTEKVSIAGSLLTGKIKFGCTSFDGKRWPIAKSTNGRWMWVGDGSGLLVFNGDVDDEDDVLVLKSLAAAKDLFEYEKHTWVSETEGEDENEEFVKFCMHWRLLLMMFGKQQAQKH